ncbi:MAG: hypothetical protein DRR08_00270 [Candidatus Parabeggiatoa sp. nov. 2]|nr:MAG: hypothetical protein B6247_00490 [Beggiatoa sp. 4572_84]RKZ64620.1 MAG: hypothetical protein DRR08_00270 [Gammaproteobacteria bacterium]
MNKTLLPVILLLWLCAFSQPTLADELLRLFTTAKERAALDKAREPKPPPKPRKFLPKVPTGTKTLSPPKPKLPRYISFDGLVIRSQGPTTVWINGSNDWSQQGFTVKLDKIAKQTVSIVLPKGKIRSLKPGQILDTSTDTIKENYELLPKIHEQPISKPPKSEKIEKNFKHTPRPSNTPLPLKGRFLPLLEKFKN